MYLKQSLVNVRPKYAFHKNDYCPHRASPIFAYSSLGSVMGKVISDLIHTPKLRGLSSRANYTDRAAAAGRRS